MPQKRIVIPRRRYQARYTNVTPAALFLECRKGAGIGYVLGKQHLGRRRCAAAVCAQVGNSFPEYPNPVRTLSYPSSRYAPSSPSPLSLPLPLLPGPRLSTAFQQLSEHLARVRDEGNKRQIALSTHLAPKAP